MRKTSHTPHLSLSAFHLSLLTSSWGQLGFTAGLVLAPAMLGLAGCSSSDCGGTRDCFSTAESPSPSDGGQGGQAPTGHGGENVGGESPGKPDVDEGDRPESEKCVPKKIDEPDPDYVDANCDGIDGDKSAAIFVDPAGDDAASGKFEEPVATLTQAIALAQKSEKSIYVCSAIYEEQVLIGTSGVQIYGGYACETWERGDTRATVRPASGVPLRVHALSGLHIEQLRFVAADVDEEMVSSMAAIVSESTAVTFTRTEFVAGRGGAGASGAAGTSLPAARNGAHGLLPCDGHGCAAALGGSSNYNDLCVGTVRSEPGGAGGNGATGTAVAKPGASAASGASGGGLSTDLNLRNGRDGVNGVAGTLGQFSPTLVGTFQEGFYVPLSGGGAGSNGAVGKAGGGGAGGNLLNGLRGSGGGQGGYAGCGGIGGGGGSGGAGSFALVIVSSEVELNQSQFVTDRGGAGGDGGKGGPGALGGSGGRSVAPAGNSVQLGGSGGKGGSGGTGGNGAPGDGGPSIAIALVGSAPPTVNDVDFDRGLGGPGGSEPSGSSARPGASLEAFDFTAGMELTL